MSKHTGKTLPRTLGGRTANLQICIVANQHKRLLVDLGVLFSRSGKTMEERKEENFFMLSFTLEFGKFAYDI